MFLSLRIAAKAMLVVASMGGTAAMAQPQAPANVNTPKPAASSAATAATAASAPASPMAYRSAFDGYKGLTDQPVQSWRESNDTVGRIGGWQSYAREGQGGPTAGSAPPSEGKGTTNMPGMPAGHGGMSTPAPRSGSATPMPPSASTPASGKAPVKVAPQKANSPAAPASMPADHNGKMKP